MRTIPIFLLILFTTCLQAQQRYIDDLFQVKEPESRVYATKDGEDLKLDIYTPENDTASARPLIVFMHGGGFAGGSPKNPAEVRFAQMAAKKGYVAVQISYRLTRKGKSFGCDYAAEGKIQTFHDAAEDFLDATEFMVAHQKEYKIDTSKVIVGGSSAGAEAVLQAVYNRNLLFDQPQKYANLKIIGVLSLAGAILDARYINEQNNIPAIFFHGTSDRLVPYATAPHHFCSPEDPGYLPLDGARSIATRLKQLDTPYALYTFEGAGHEISGMPFKEMPQVFHYFKQIFLEGEFVQAEILKKKEE